MLIVRVATGHIRGLPLLWDVRSRTSIIDGHTLAVSRSVLGPVWPSTSQSMWVPYPHLQFLAGRQGTMRGCLGSSRTSDLGSPARYRSGNSAGPSAYREGGGHTLAAFTPERASYTSGLGAAATGPVPGPASSSALSILILSPCSRGRRGLHPPARGGRARSTSRRHSCWDLITGTYSVPALISQQLLLWFLIIHATPAALRSALGLRPPA